MSFHSTVMHDTLTTWKTKMGNPILCEMKAKRTE